MAAKEYEGLKAELVSFGNEDINTVTIPAGYSGCEVGGVTWYVTPAEGMVGNYGTCYYYDEDDLEFSWASYGKRIS